MSKKRLQLTRDHLIHLAKSPQFYIHVPEFLYLRDTAMYNWKYRREAVAGCSRCGADWLAMKGVCDCLFMKLREMKTNNDPALQKVKDFLSEKKGYEVVRCVLYYRRSKKQGKIAKLEF